MDLKKTYQKVKTKIKDNPDEVAFAITYTSAVLALCLARRSSKKLAKERAAHAVCHDIAKWLYLMTGEGEETTIEVRKNKYYVVNRTKRRVRDSDNFLIRN